MKIFATVYIFILILNNQAISQGLNDIPPYQITNPKWQYFSFDNNFPEDNKGLQHTPYSCMARAQSIEKGDYIYLLENTFTAINGYSGWDGFILSKLNKQIGEVAWVYQHNQHVGVKNYERPSPYIGFDSNGNIEILTTRDRDTMIKDYKFYWEFVGTPAIHTIDDITGQKLDFKYGLDTTRTDNTRFTGGSKLHWQGENKYLNILYWSYNIDGLTKDRIDFHKVDDSLNIGKQPFYGYQIDTDIESPYDENYKPWIESLYNQDTMIVLTGLSDIEDYFNSPKKAFLRWFNIKDHNHIQQLKVVEVSDAFARPQKNTFRYDPRLIFKPGHVFLTQVMQPNTKLPHDHFVWMWWLNTQGWILGTFPYVKWLDTFYLRIEPIGVKNNKLYMTGRYYDFQENKERYDILEVAPYSNSTKKVGEFLNYNHNSGNFRINILKSDFLDNGDIYFDLSIRSRKNNLEYWYLSSVVVEAKNLGIISSNKEIANNIHWSWAYPNPTADILHIQKEIGEPVEIYIRDITGNILLQKTFDQQTEIELSLIDFPSGMYYVTIIDKSGKNQSMTHKVVKL
ncbi:MAG: T9SS type A sorting domain-containing protein [Saprospiraceae bacterium]